MLKTRVIPALLLREGALVKTIRFGKFQYVGDPINTVRIFNELEVDELVLLDIAATKSGRPPDFELLRKIADECFMPLTYGGGIRTVDDIQRLFGIGIEKAILNSHAVERPSFISEASSAFGSQATVVSIDVKKNIFGNKHVWSVGGTRNSKRDPTDWARTAEKLGAGEIFLTSIDREGTWSGFDLDLIKGVSASVGIPVIAHGGAGNLAHLEEAVKVGGAAALALGSMVVYQRRGLGVLINFPDREDLERHIHLPSV